MRKLFKNSNCEPYGERADTVNKPKRTQKLSNV